MDFLALSVTPKYVATEAADKIAIIAITTTNSTRVKPFLAFFNNFFI